MDTLHLKAPGSWINDPNGFIYYKGKYHLFFQHFPFSTRWGTMHWGHAVSDDLIHWKHLGVALFPTKHYDQDGIFSGSALEVDGKMFLYYTGVKYYASEADNCQVPLSDIYECCQVLISSEDGFHFDNYNDKKIFLPVIYDDDIASFNHTRDPKLWKENDRYYMLLGSTHQKETGRLLVLSSKDALHWEIRSTVEDRRLGRILECPDMFTLGGKRVLLISPMYIVPESEGYAAQSMIGTVDFDPDTCQISNPGDFFFIDHGRDLYATQTCEDEEGRRVMIAWVRMPKEMQNPWDEKAWNGMMCVPRVIEYREDGFHFLIHPNVRKYFSRELSADEISLYRPNEKKPCLIETRLSNGDTLNIGGYRISMENDTVSVDRSEVFPQEEDSQIRTSFSLPSYARSYQLTIIVEANVIELYMDDGKHVLTNCVYSLSDTLSGKIDRLFVPEEDL